MTKLHKEECKALYEDGHTFYGIAYQIKQDYGTVYTEKQIQKALGGVPNNPVSVHRKG